MVLSGVVEKGRQPTLELRQTSQWRSLLRRSGFAQAGLRFAVLTYYEYARRAKPTPPKWLRRPGAPAALLDGLFSTAPFINNRI